MAASKNILCCRCFVHKCAPVFFARYFHLKGFSLLELMISITIVSILAAIAIPSYQDYTVRAKVSEALNFFSVAKLAVSEYYVATGNLPENASQAGIASVTTDYIADIDYTSDDASGDIIITLGTDIHASVDGKKINLRATVERGFLDWKCQPSDDNGLPSRFLPASCR